VAFAQFHPIGPIPPTTFARYEQLVPPAVADSWRQYGAGFVDDGYFRQVDPARAAAMVGNVNPVLYNSVILFTTAMADLIVYWDDFFLVIKLRLGEIHPTKITFDKLVQLMQDVPTDEYGPGYRDAIWDQQPYPAVRSRLGVPAFEDCFMHVPLLKMGGRGDPAQMQIGSVWTHIALMYQLTGAPQISHNLPKPTEG